jgi:hypothetical protein
VVTRRGLLLAGGATLLAGCGRDEAAVPPPAPVDVLRGELAAERRAVAAVSGPARARAAERARRLAAAVSEAGGRAHDAPQGEDGGDPEAALAAAVAAHVGALPDVPEQRALVTDLIAGAAADLAREQGVATAFPGSGT